jgi:hypothetical protein
MRGCAATDDGGQCFQNGQAPAFDTRGQHEGMAAIRITI